MQMIILINQLILDLVMDDELVEGTVGSQWMSFNQSGNLTVCELENGHWNSGFSH